MFEMHESSPNNNQIVYANTGEPNAILISYIDVLNIEIADIYIHIYISGVYIATTHTKLWPTTGG